MKNTDFMKALGKVDARYVEETLNARESGGRRIFRWDPLPAIGVLSGAAVCAAMVLTIIAVKNPSGEAMKPYTSGESAVGTQVSVDEAVIHTTDDGYTYCDPNSATNIYDFKVVDGTVTPTGLQLDVKRLAENTTGHYVTWRLETSQGQLMTNGISVNGILNADSPTGISPLGETWRAEIGWYKNGEPLVLPPGNYNLVFYATDEDGKEILPADAKYIPFSYGMTVTDANGNPYNPYKSLKTYDMIIPEESVTKDGLTLNMNLPEKTDATYLVTWSLYTHSGLTAEENTFLTNSYTPDSPITIPAGSVGTHSIDISWSDQKRSTHPIEIEPGWYALTVIVLNVNPESSNPGPVSFGTVEFGFGEHEPIVSTTTEPVTTTTATDTEVVIHFPCDPYVEGTTTTTAVTAPAEYNDGKVRVIAEFRETMGKEPAVLSDEEAAKITSLIDGLSLIPSTKSYGDAYAQERTGGCYLIYANGKRYELWDETMIRYDGNYYVMTKDGDTKGGKALLDEVIAMVMKYQP